MIDRPRNDKNDKTSIWGYCNYASYVQEDRGKHEHDKNKKIQREFLEMKNTVSEHHTGWNWLDTVEEKIS